MTTQQSPVQSAYTVADARYVLSLVYCVDCVPMDGDMGHSRPWAPGLGTAECCRCHCTYTPDLRLWIASEAAGRAWAERENAAIDAHRAEQAS